jgi:VanZ like family
MGVIIEVFWGRAGVRLGLSAAVLVACLVAVTSARRGRNWPVSFGLTLSAGLILANTMFGVIGQTGSGLAWWSQCRIGTASELVRGPGSPEGLANVVLFVPLGLFSVAASRRVGVAVAAGLALSVLVEAIQGLTWGRDCAAADVVSNIAGALVGSLVALAAIRWPRVGFVSAVRADTSTEDDAVDAADG